MQKFESIEEAVETFLQGMRRGDSSSAREFGSRHAYLGEELVQTLESLEILEASRPPLFAQMIGAGARLGPYQILREIGHGGMGVVFEAVESSLGRRVALKCLPPELVMKSDARARFEREAEITSKLDHSGICTVFGAGVTDAQPWIAMRFVEGETLAQRIANARLRKETLLELPGAGDTPSSRVLAIARCIALVARALVAAHERGFVHRDVKPSNVMVTPQGEPVLLDFGLATATDGEAALTRTGEHPGTPAYLAPEMLDGSVSKPDARCDVYSLGVTLYECLALAPPFAAPTREALFHSILFGTPRRLALHDPNISRDLEVLVATAMERDRARRYAGAAEMAADLERVIAGRPIAARPISNFGRVTRWVRREPRQAALSMGLAVAALGLALLGGMHWASRDAVLAAESFVRARNVEHQLVEGFHALALDDHAGAEKVFAGVLAHDPQNTEALVGRVLVSIDGHDEVEARRRLEQAPRTPVFDDLRAMLEGRVDVVSDTARLENADALQLFVSGTRLRHILNRSPRSERPALAKIAYQRLTAAALQSSSPRALFHAERAFAAIDTKDREAARSSAASLLALWPDQPMEMFAAAIALSDIDDARSAQLLERVTQAMPSFHHAWTSLAQHRLRSKDAEGALAAAETAIRLEPRAYEAHSVAARCYAELGCPGEARLEFGRVVALSPEVFEYWANWAQLECDQHEWARAADLLACALDLDPFQPQAHWWRAHALGELERWSEAREHFEIAAALVPKNPAMWQGLLSATTALNDLEGTSIALESALEVQPGHKSLLDLKANVERLRARH